MEHQHAALKSAAYRIRRFALRIGEVQGQGYVGQALGMADILAVAYRHALHDRPEAPEWEGRDRFMLSLGHYAIALYQSNRFGKRNVRRQQNDAKVCSHKRHRILLGTRQVSEKFRVTRKTVATKKQRTFIDRRRRNRVDVARPERAARRRL